VDAEYHIRPPSNDLHGCDEDADRDGVTNGSDNCPEYPHSNSNQADGDCDLVGDACDNCPSTYNPNQADSDLDGIGDDCEAGATTSSQYSQSVPLVIPDNYFLGVSTSINVPTSGVIADLDVQLQIAHPRQSDLVVELAHSGKTVKLIYRAGTPEPFAGCGPAAVGYSAANFGSVGNPLVLDDCAPVVVDCYNGEGSGIAGYHGPVHANRLLQAFAGLDKKGIWKLSVFDEVAGNAGVLNSWALLFDELPAPPSTGVPTLSFVGMLASILALVGAALWILSRRG
jgi:subtilisin-like proprotein convertase family protein